MTAPEWVYLRMHSWVSVESLESSMNLKIESYFKQGKEEFDDKNGILINFKDGCCITYHGTTFALKRHCTLPYIKAEYINLVGNWSPYQHDDASFIHHARQYGHSQIMLHVKANRTNYLIDLIENEYQLYDSNDKTKRPFCLTKETKPTRDADFQSYLDSCDEHPDEFTCPISQSLILDAVIAEDGMVYEKEAILIWIAKKQRNNEIIKSPVTNKEMSPILYPGHCIKKSGLDAYVDKMKLLHEQKWKRSIENSTSSTKRARTCTSSSTSQNCYF